VWHSSAYADDVHLLEENMNARNKSTEAVIDDSNDVVVEVSTMRTRYVLLSRHQEEPNTEIVNRALENAEKLNYLGTKVTIQNFTWEEITRRLIVVNAAYNSFQNLLSSRLNIKKKNYDFACSFVSV
jgi:hypothetical protein